MQIIDKLVDKLLIRIGKLKDIKLNHTSSLG